MSNSNRRSLIRGTPRFEIDLPELASRYREFAKLGTVYYPCKAMDHEIIITTLRDLGCRFELDSVGHIEHLLSLGVDPECMQYSIPVRTIADSATAYSLGVRQFVIDSLDELSRLHQAVDGACRIVVRLGLRGIVNPPDIRYDKWGAQASEVRAIMEVARRHGHELLGLSFYMPQEVYSSSTLSRVLAHVVAHFSPGEFAVVDIGGGLDDFNSSFMTTALDELKQHLQLTDIYVEPGRNLVDDCIDMVSGIVAVERRGREDWAYLDAGIYSGLLDRVLKGRHYQVTAEAPDQNPSIIGEQIYQLAGATSDTLDYLGEFAFPVELSAGSSLRFHGVGAYSYVLRTPFAGFPSPEVVVA